MKLSDWLHRPRSASDTGTSFARMAGESTSLLTQTAGAIFGLMPILISGRQASAATTQQDGFDQAADAMIARHGAADHASFQAVPPASVHLQLDGKVSAGGAPAHAAVVSHLPAIGSEAGEEVSQAGPAEPTVASAAAPASDIVHGSAAGVQMHLPEMSTGQGEGSGSLVTQGSAPFVAHDPDLPSASSTIQGLVERTVEIVGASIQKTAMHLASDASQSLHQVGDILHQTDATVSSVLHPANTLTANVLHVDGDLGVGAIGTGGAAAATSALAHGTTHSIQSSITTQAAHGVTASPTVLSHAASPSSDGSPIHLPLIGQSFADHDLGHEAGFNIHVLHGL